MREWLGCAKTPTPEKLEKPEHTKELEFTEKGGCTQPPTPDIAEIKVNEKEGCAETPTHDKPEKPVNEVKSCAQTPTTDKVEIKGMEKEGCADTPTHDKTEKLEIPGGDSQGQVGQIERKRGTGWDTLVVDQAKTLNLKKSTRKRTKEKEKRTHKKGAEVVDIPKEKRNIDMIEIEEKKIELEKRKEKENEKTGNLEKEKRKRKRENDSITANENRKKNVVSRNQKTHRQTKAKPMSKPSHKTPKETILKYLVKGGIGPSGAAKTSGEPQEPGHSSNLSNIIVKSKSEASPLGVWGGTSISTTVCRGGTD